MQTGCIEFGADQIESKTALLTVGITVVQRAKHMAYMLAHVRPRPVAKRRRVASRCCDVGSWRRACMSV